MTGQGPLYDHIGTKYNEYSRTATFKRAERYTVLRMVGNVDGCRVLDLACGAGFYARLLKQHGAGQVMGVDLSPEMIRIATQQEQAEPLGITYQVANVSEVGKLGAFDLITAMHLFNYAKTKEELVKMFQAAYRNLVKNGRFVAYTVNPTFRLSKSNVTKYGITITNDSLVEDRHIIEGFFVVDPSTPVNTYQWSQATYEWALKEAGFREFTWVPSEASPEDVEQYGKEYWQDYHDNCLCIGLICNK